MCKQCNKNHTNTNIRDRCMKIICDFIDNQTKYECLASCCGHGKYPLTIIVTRGYGNPIEWFSQIEIPRKRKFYKKDKAGYYYIPEVSTEKKL